MKKIILSALVIMSSSFSIFSQIPNSGFENWTSMGNYSNPDQWGTVNYMADSLSVYSCSKGTPGHPGAAYLVLHSYTAGSLGVLPGIAATGTIDANYKVHGGFPFTQQPQSISGHWQYMATGGEKGFVAVYLTKWNSVTHQRDTVSQTIDSLTGMVMVWATFNIPLAYQMSVAPDSAQIILSASGKNPSDGSYLVVDSLTFSGSAASVNELQDLSKDITVSPNPSPGIITLTYADKKGFSGKIEILDVVGNVIYSSRQTNSVGAVIDLSSSPKGFYFVRLSSENGIGEKKIVIQ